MLRYCFIIFSLLLILSVDSAQAQGVPVIIDNPLSTGDNIPETCDEDFWDVVRYKSQMAAQREITQNANLIPKPDSVLEISCFEDHMEHMARYAERYFPGDPQFSDGRDFGLPIPPEGFWTDTFVVMVRELIGDIDPWLAGRFGLKGGQMRHILAMLILDTLVDDVSSIGSVLDAINLLGCDKYEYIEENFDHPLIGGRSRFYNGAALVPQTEPNWNDEVDLNNYSGCAMMNNVWNQVRCDNFQHDDTVAAGNEFTAMYPNDRFHIYQDYVDEEIAGRDFRVYPRMCQRETRSNSDILVDMACAVANHGYGFGDLAMALANHIDVTIPGYSPDPAAPDPTTPWNLDTSAPTLWQELFARTYLDTGTPGTLDPYWHYFDLLDNTNCNAITPVRTGLIVRVNQAPPATGVIEYYDAVCPPPGCWYDPPTTLAGTGTCEP